MTRRLFTNGTIRTVVDDGDPDWVLVDEDRIVGVGAFSDSPDADEIVDLDGGTLVPSFCDAHVHLPATGLQAAGLDLRSERSVDAIVAAFRERASTGSILYGGNFEDPLDRPLTRHDLDDAVGPRPALMSRADLHSCIVSTALLDALDIADLPGVDRDADGAPTGYLREQAAGAAWRWFDANLSLDQQSAAVNAAAGRCYSKGVTSVHEMYVVEWRGWNSLDVFLSVASGLALEVVVYVGTLDVEAVAARRLPRIGGDLFLDGSFGSHTAWLSEPYEGAAPSGSSPTGISYRSDDKLFDMFVSAQEVGLQVGVHAIGDAAIEQAITTWERVADKVGPDAVRAGAHRIEHFECATDDHIARAARLGLTGSVQPAFDRLWGGSDGLYARRIGAGRAAGMNRFRSMLDAGMVLGAGSDSTVTPLDPFLQMASLRDHHMPDQSVGGRVALMLHTYGSRLLAGAEPDAGYLAPGARADLAWLDTDPVTAEPGALLDTEVLGTWIGGQRIWP
ncbi:MAG TPA: amidohydrolase [Actinomycetota bacterium]|nr:amidohydrolase [Actinomycetota bacterium]